MWSRIAGRNDGHRKVRVVAAVQSEGLARVLEHLLVEADDLECFVGVPSAAALLSGVSHLAPDVIVVALSCLGSEPATRIVELKAAAPTSRLLLIGSVGHDEARTPTGADARIPAEAVVATLIAEVRKLARSPLPRTRSSRPIPS